MGKSGPRLPLFKAVSGWGSPAEISIMHTRVVAKTAKSSKSGRTADPCPGPFTSQWSQSVLSNRVI